MWDEAESGQILRYIILKAELTGPEEWSSSFIVVLYTIVRYYKQSEWPSERKWRQQQWYIHTTEFEQCSKEWHSLHASM